jgi:hypothetical protein
MKNIHESFLKDVANANARRQAQEGGLPSPISIDLPLQREWELDG